MKFGLKNAAHAFQRHMDTVFQLVKYVFVYLDGILIDSPSAKEHLSDLNKVSIENYAFIVTYTHKCATSR